MKLAAQHVEGFLRNPAGCSVALFFGDDAGLIQERAAMLVRAVAGSTDDPFLVVQLARDQLATLPDEAASLPLTGGRRVVRVRDVTDAALSFVAPVLQRPGPALVVMEAAASLSSRSRLRTAVEAAPEGVAIGCYPDDPARVQTVIKDTLGRDRITVDADALRWLSSQLGADRVSTRAELEKLALHVGTSGRVDLETAMACVGDLAGLSLDDALFAATEGRVDLADRALQLAMAEGSDAVGVLRAGLYHLERLHRARLLMDEGLPAAEATKAARPPIFFRRTGSFTNALGLWSSAALLAAIAGLSEAERECKRTGAPDGAICRNAVLVVARRAVESAARARPR